MLNRQTDVSASFETSDGRLGETRDHQGAFETSVRDYGGLDQLPTEARALFEQEGGRRFFNGLSWYRVFCETCLDPGQHPVFLVATADRADRAELILPLIAPLGRKGSRLSERQLGPTTRMSLTNYQTAQFGPITNASGEVLAHLLESVARRLKEQGCTVLDFNHLDTGIPENDLLQPAFERAGFKTYAYADEPIVLETINGRSYDAYMKDRSSKLRRNIKRLRANLEKVGEVRFALVAGGDGLEGAIRDYETVQKASWKPDEFYDDHVPALIRAAAGDGMLRLGLLYVDDRPVATDLTIISNGDATGKKGHFDNEMRQHHVGDVLTSHMFEYLIDEDRAKTIDFGKTAVSYKLKWAKELRPMNGFVAFHPGMLEGQLRRLRYRAEQIARSRLSVIKRKLMSLRKQD
jgi:hypothetical protein